MISFFTIVNLHVCLQVFSLMNKDLINQSINQSINQPINQSISLQTFARPSEQITSNANLLKNSATGGLLHCLFSIYYNLMATYKIQTERSQKKCLRIYHVSSQIINFFSWCSGAKKFITPCSRCNTKFSELTLKQLYGSL